MLFIFVKFTFAYCDSLKQNKKQIKKVTVKPMFFTIFFFLTWPPGRPGAMEFFFRTPTPFVHRRSLSGSNHPVDFDVMKSKFNKRFLDYSHKNINFNGFSGNHINPPATGTDWIFRFWFWLSNRFLKGPGFLKHCNGVNRFLKRPANSD